MAEKTIKASGRAHIRRGMANTGVGSQVINILDGVGEMRAVDKIVTAAQMLALAATPIELVAAPGVATHYLEFMGATVFLDYGGTAYAADAGEDISIKYTAGTVVSNAIDGEVLEATADTLWTFRALVSAQETAVVANTGFVLDNVGAGEIITGNSPLKIRTYYRIHKALELAEIA
jgi:hypothetical protein